MAQLRVADVVGSDVRLASLRVARPPPPPLSPLRCESFPLKLNSTTRTRHGPDRTRTDFFCGETPLGPCGSGRVRVVEFSSYPTTCADFVRVRSVSGPCRVRVRVRVVEFSYYRSAGACCPHTGTRMHRSKLRL